MRGPRQCTSVAILGCGVVGFSWAVVFARHGLEARLFNRPSSSLATVRGQGAHARSSSSGTRESSTSARSPPPWTGCSSSTIWPRRSAPADYVQEALPEDLALKQTTFARVAAMTSADVVIASSCSGLRRADIVSRVEHHPERCLVVHPANPPHLIPFVEISGDGASDEAKQAARRLMEAVGQRPVLCREIYGYVLNRLQLALIQQALWLVQHDICSVPAVEAALTDGLGLRWALHRTVRSGGAELGVARRGPREVSGVHAARALPSSARCASSTRPSWRGPLPGSPPSAGQGPRRVPRLARPPARAARRAQGRAAD